MVKTNAEQGVILNVIVGIIGAVIGGAVMNLLGEKGVTGFNLYSFIVALLEPIHYLLISLQQQRNERQYDHLTTGSQFSLAIFP